MSEKKDYFDYVENVLGVKSIMLNPKQNTPLLIAVEDLLTYSADEQDLLGKMVGALKIDPAKISIVDMNEAGNYQSEYGIFFRNQPAEKTNLKNATTHRLRPKLERSSHTFDCRIYRVFLSRTLFFNRFFD